MTNSMNKEELSFLVRILHRINYFASCSSNEIDRLLSKFTIKKYPKGKTIISKNTIGSRFYIIYKGKVEINFRKSFLHKKVMAHLEDGDFFGEISIILGIPTTANVKALKKTTLFSLKRSDFMDILERNPELHEKIKNIAQKRVDATQEEVQSQEGTDKIVEEKSEEEPEEKKVVPKKRVIRRIKYKWK